MKTEAGKVHQSQAKWHSGLNVHVCYGWEETEAAIRGFLEPKAPRSGLPAEGSQSQPSQNEATR